MITATQEREQLKRQVLRLGTLSYFRADEPTVLQEYLDTLADCCCSVEHARLVVDRVVESVSECPAPAEIRRTAADIYRERFAPSMIGCAECEYTGFRHFRQDGLDFVRFCECRSRKR